MGPAGSRGKASEKATPELGDACIDAYVQRHTCARQMHALCTARVGEGGHLNLCEPGGPPDA